MKSTRVISILASISLGTVCVVGCGDDSQRPEPKSATTSHLDEGQSDESGEVTDQPSGDPAGAPSGEVALNDPGSDTGQDPNVSSGDQQLANPALIIIGVVVVAVVGTCAIANAVCSRGADKCVGGRGKSVSSCTTEILSGKVSLSCEVSCPNGEASSAG